MTIAQAYKLLRVAPNASTEEIKRAYHQAALAYHPDQNPLGNATEKMREFNEAYDLLRDPIRRRGLDMEQSSREQAQSPAAQRQEADLKRMFRKYRDHQERQKRVFRNNLVVAGVVGLLLVAALSYKPDPIQTSPRELARIDAKLNAAVMPAPSPKSNLDAALADARAYNASLSVAPVKVLRALPVDHPKNARHGN